MKTKHAFLGWLCCVTLPFFVCCKHETITPQITPEPTEPLKNTRKVLIENFTGHTCSNCPKAAEKLHELKTLYHDQLIAVNLHASFFALPNNENYPPAGAPKGSFTSDYRTLTGTEYDRFFKISEGGLPHGMINRKGFPANTHSIPNEKWALQLANTLKLPADAGIGIKKTYTEHERKLDMSVTVRFLTELDAEFKLVLLITQDSIQDWQLEKPGNTQPPKATHNYLHRNVLRGAVNGTWGEVISTGPVSNSKEVSKNFSYTLEPRWQDKHCYIVAFVYNSTTYEILQAEEIKVK